MSKTEITTIKSSLIVMNAINEFLTDLDATKFIKTLTTFDNAMKRKLKGGKDKSIWFRLPADSTSVETVRDISETLLLKRGSNNRTYMLECLELSRSGDFEIHYS